MEEKVERKELLKSARSLLNCPGTPDSLKQVLLQEYPELAESEVDGGVQQQPLVWKRIKRGEKLPCRAYLYKLAYEQERNFGGIATVDGYLVPNDPVRVGCDTWYLSADAVKNLPKEGQQ